MTDDTLKALLRFRQLPRKAKLLGILGVDAGRPKGQRQIRGIARELGLGEVRRWRLNDLFSQLAKEVRLSRLGWQLTPAGFDYVGRIPQLLRQLEEDERAQAPAPSAADTSAATESAPEASEVLPAPLPPPPAPGEVTGYEGTPSIVSLPAACTVPPPVADSPPDNERPRKTPERKPARARKATTPAERYLETCSDRERASAAALLDDIAGAITDGGRTARQLAWAAVRPCDLAAMTDALALSFSPDRVRLALHAVRGVLEQEVRSGRLNKRQLAARLAVLVDTATSTKRRARGS